jgi:DNA-binding GntR family transcriptional regulator
MMKPANGNNGDPGTEPHSLHEKVYLELRTAISSGTFASGETVTIRGLAGMLGTSPMPVREAVRRLVQDRSLEMLPNRSMRVPLMSRARFDELADIRANVEGYAAGRTAERLSGREFAAIRSINDRMGVAIRQGDVPEVIGSNRAFHFAIYAAAGSEVLLSVIENLWQQSGPYLAALLHALSAAPNALATVGFGRHFELIVALDAGDAEAARQAMTDDILTAAEWYRYNVLFDADPEDGKKEAGHAVL